MNSLFDSVWEHQTWSISDVRALKPEGRLRSDLSLPCPTTETKMAIKGLKEALAKKQSKQHPDNRLTDGAEVKSTPTAPTRAGANKPQKKVTGRGR